MNKRILRQCLQMAVDNNTAEKHPDYGNYHHFSFIISKGKILEMGMNRKGDPLIHYGYSPVSKIHAETEAYRKSKGLLERNQSFKCVNIRLTKTGQIRISAPCECCFNYLKILGCKTIYFSTNFGEFAKLSL